MGGGRVEGGGDVGGGCQSGSRACALRQRWDGFGIPDGFWFPHFLFLLFFLFRGRKAKINSLCRTTINTRTGTWLERWRGRRACVHVCVSSQTERIWGRILPFHMLQVFTAKRRQE